MPIRNLKTVMTPLRKQRALLDRLLEGTSEPPRALAEQPLAEQIKVFEQIERGDVPRRTADVAFVREVEETVEQLVRVLYQPLDGRPFIMPRDAWTASSLMQLLASVTYWLYEDDVITIAEAARVLYGSSELAMLARVRRAIERGELRHYWRPGREHKERQAFLVRRSEVERLKHRHTAS